MLTANEVTDFTTVVVLPDWAAWMLTCAKDCDSVGAAAGWETTAVEKPLATETALDLAMAEFSVCIHEEWIMS